MPNSQTVIDRLALCIAAGLCLAGAFLMLLLDVQSLIVDLVYQGF